MRLVHRAARGTATVLVVLATMLTASCGGVQSGEFTGNIQALLAEGESYVRGLPRTPAAELSDQDVIALGYLERSRLGFGSPFRIIDYALRDPSLDLDTRERLAYGILALTLREESYQVDPSVLGSVEFFGLPASRAAAPGQLALINRTIRSASSPAGGERAVRLGYRIAEAERSISRVPHSVIAQVAALVSDRFRAAEDAGDLLREAGRTGADPLGMLQAWRRTRRFSVEAPSRVPLHVSEEAAVARTAPQFARSLDALALRIATSGRAVPRAGDRRDVRTGYLPDGAGTRLLTLSTQRAYPPQAPVAVGVSVMRNALGGTSDLTEEQRAARADFVSLAYNEERLVAASAVLREADSLAIARFPLINLQVSSLLRAWGQEEPWFPGDPGPAARELIARFGLAAIEFDEAVPEAWRPYSLRTLGRALSDLQRVMPTASVRGLRIHFGPIPRERVALALHDPRTRTLYLPLESGSGTIAHEIAHDLDWQLARQRYGLRGGYATDLSVRAGRGDRIAASLENLEAAFRRPGTDTLIDSHDTRPAEVFARGSDWFISAALAREGRTGGYLSSFQDPALTGYGSTRGPDIGGAAVPALLTIYDAIAPVTDDIRSWAHAELGPSRMLSPTELAAAVLYAGYGEPPEERLAAIAAARDRSLSSVDVETCRFSSTEAMRQLAIAQRELVVGSAASAARGAAIDAVRDLAAATLGSGDRRVEEWLAWRLQGAPEPTDSTVMALGPAFEDHFSRAEIVAREEPMPGGTAFDPSLGVSICGGNPFAAGAVRRAPTAFGVPPVLDRRTRPVRLSF